MRPAVHRGRAQGPPLQERGSQTAIDIKISTQGEILCRGATVSSGYYDDEESTRKTFEEGYFKTGDLGRLDNDGYLSIIGRIKGIIITKSGTNVSPLSIEPKLDGHPEVHKSIVVGDNWPYLTALLFIEPAKSEDHGREPTLEELRVKFDPLIEEANRSLSVVEQIRCYRIIIGRLDPERGELTPTMKIRRYQILENHKDAIEQMYASGIKTTTDKMLGGT